MNAMKAGVLNAEGTCAAAGVSAAAKNVRKNQRGRSISEGLQPGGRSTAVLVSPATVGLPWWAGQACRAVIKARKHAPGSRRQGASVACCASSQPRRRLVRAVAQFDHRNRAPRIQAAASRRAGPHSPPAPLDRSGSRRFEQRALHRASAAFLDPAGTRASVAASQPAVEHLGPSPGALLGSRARVRSRRAASEAGGRHAPRQPGAVASAAAHLPPLAQAAHCRRSPLVRVCA